MKSATKQKEKQRTTQITQKSQQQVQSNSCASRITKIIYVLTCVIVALLAIGALSVPKFTQRIMFSMDHVLGRQGYKENSYHCDENRFAHTNNYNELVFEAPPGMASSPPTIDAKDYTPELLREVSQNYRLPVVVKGLFTDSKAGKFWNFPYFDKSYGSQKIIYMDTEFPIKNISSSYQRQKNPTTLHNYIQNVTNGQYWILGNDHQLLVDFPELIEQLEIHRWKTFDGEEVLPLTLRLFMGGKHTGVGWHAATSHNLFIEVRGKKLFKWLDPRLYSYIDMYPTLSNRLPAIEHCTGHYYNPQIKTWEYILDNGDAAFTPAWVWHATHHFEPTIAVGLRMESFLHDARSSPLLTFLGEFSLDIPGIPFFNGALRGFLQGLGVRLQGQALSRQEKETGYKWDWLRDYIQAGGKVLSESEQKDKTTQWKL